jgi:hypothetical protein
LVEEFRLEQDVDADVGVLVDARLVTLLAATARAKF